MRRLHVRSTPTAGFLAVWLLTFGLLVVIIEMWSLATPIDGAPDEGTQFIKAASVVRGEWLGPQPRGPGTSAFTMVRVPEVFAELPVGGCFIFHPTRSAGCPGVHVSSSRTVVASTYVGHYPPLYYLLVGGPSVLGTKTSLYLVRGMSVLVNAAMLALAMATAYRWSRSALMLPALAIAITPMVLFLSSVVNPSGLEITAAISMWTAGTVLVVDHPRTPPTGLVAILAASTSVLVLTRGVSPLWPLVCLCVLLPLAWGRVAIRSLLARRDVQIGSAAVAFAVIAALSWTVFAHGLAVAAQGVPGPHTSSAAIARVVSGQSRNLLLQSIGVFGWVDTPAPPLTQLIWIGVGGGLVLVALLVGYKRSLSSVALAIGLGVGLPFVLSDLTARHSGLIAQGRYFLPLAVSIPIVAGAVSSQGGLPRRATSRLAAGVVWLAAAGQVAAAAWTLHRYLVGSEGPLLPTAVVPGVWRPPLPGWVLDLVFVVAWTCFAILLVRLSVRRSPERVRGNALGTLTG